MWRRSESSRWRSTTRSPSLSWSSWAWWKARPRWWLEPIIGSSWRLRMVASPKTTKLLCGKRLGSILGTLLRLRLLMLDFIEWICKWMDGFWVLKCINVPNLFWRINFTILFAPKETISSSSFSFSWFWWFGCPTWNWLVSSQDLKRWN